MNILDIRVLGDPVLRRQTGPVSEITDDIRSLISDMFDTMYAAEGIGLAAPQVGRSERIAVVDVEGQRHALINPEIIAEEGSARAEEGCLSIPEIYGEVDRAFRVVVRATNENGEQVDIPATELLARCMQHEIDHLDGKLFIDYLSVLKRRSAMSKWDKMKNDYPGFIRRVILEKPGAHHSEGEL
ncbi:MAG TPA: peptide deformylase [Gemmatimonadaceae bacterium]|nr:peptide deformylase [Gemmatimonadaceae bacterium]